MGGEGGGGGGCAERLARVEGTQIYMCLACCTVITVMCSSFLFTCAGTSDFTVETSSITYIPSDPSRQADPVIPLRFSISRDNIALEGNETFNISLATSDMLMENEFIGAPVTVTIRDADGKKKYRMHFLLQNSGTYG